MSRRELERVEMMRNLKRKSFSQIEVGQRLGITARQVRRLKQAYELHGEAGLVSKKRGQPSNRRLTEAFRSQVLKLISAHYADYGPTLAQEKLEEKHKLTLSIETLRKWMIEENIWSPKKAKKAVIHPMRPRRSQYGDLVQIDGSPHDWFENRGPRCTLLVYIDDATSRLVELFFSLGETTESYFKATKRYLKRCGKPLAFYSDKYGVFRVNHKEAVSGNGVTEFGRVLKKLDIKLICANTPQAKGRVEKANQTLQDRLVKEMREKNISTIEKANEWIPEFIEKYNKKFAVAPRNAEDAHRALKPEENLEEIFSYQEIRCLSKNLSFQYKNSLYQIDSERSSYTLRKAKVMLLEDLNGRVRVLYKGKELKYKIYGEEPQGKIVMSKEIDLALNWINKKPQKPSRSHPWR
ncbi:MAG: ISNCY family transposase [Rhabdochlamydiaceae bacterium]